MNTPYLPIEAPNNRAKIDFLPSGKQSPENPHVEMTVLYDRKTGELDIRLRVMENEGDSQWKEKDIQIDTFAAEL